VPLAGRLKKLLEDSDTEAAEAVDELVEAVRGTGMAAAVDAIAAAVDGSDYEAALDALWRLEALGP
jgi:hypothetical protein